MDLAQLHPTQFKWDETHSKSFKQMTKALIENSSLYLLQPNKPFFVQTDASNMCGAGRVFQKNDNWLKESMVLLKKKF